MVEYDPEQASVHEAVQSKYANGASSCCYPAMPSTAPRLVEVAQTQLAKIGGKVNIELADAATFRRRWLQERQWDFVQLQWDADRDPDETLYRELHSTEAWNAGKWVKKGLRQDVKSFRMVPPGLIDMHEVWLD